MWHPVLRVRANVDMEKWPRAHKYWYRLLSSMLIIQNEVRSTIFFVRLGFFPVTRSNLKPIRSEVRKTNRMGSKDRIQINIGRAIVHN